MLIRVHWSSLIEVLRKSGTLDKSKLKSEQSATSKPSKLRKGCVLAQPPPQITYTYHCRPSRSLLE
eukprot:6475064-Amphidinium_carterae.1